MAHRARPAVILRDIDATQVGKGLATVRKLYDEGVKRHLFTRTEAQAGLDRISPAPTEVPLLDVDLVIEAAVEKMDLKKDIFRRLAAQTDSHTILATNTSALSVNEIAAATTAPKRIVGLHFFNPVHRMQLVEVVAGDNTEPAVLDRAVRFVQQIGKLPVVVRDRPGFLVNRILMPYLLEAAQLFETGARIRDIDEAMLRFGMPMGPLRLVDEIGVDVASHVAKTLVESFSDRLYLPTVLGEMLKAGLLGRKSGRGFYCHEQKKAATYDEMEMFQWDHSSRHLSVESLERRLVLAMVNEAARCLDEGVVATPDDVDFAMVMGAGFAPFRGGPLRYADSAGVREIAGEMDRLADAGAMDLAPCALLKEMAKNNRMFYPNHRGAL